MLTRAFIPVDIQAIIEGSDFASNIYSYIPMKKWNLYPSFIHRFEFELTNQSLEPFGIEYSSTFANSTPILAGTFLMIMFSFCVILLRLLFSLFKDSKRWSCLAKVLYWIVDKFYRMLIFGYYIRNAMEMSQFLLVSSINEIYESNTTSSYRVISFIFSLLMILAFALMIGILLYLVYSSYKLIENNHNKLEEFFRGIQQERRHRFYTVLLLLRRFVFIILLITWTWIPSRVIIVILTSLQVAYIIYLTYIRPFQETKGNIIEILNEFYFIFLLLFLAFINTEVEWNSTKSNIYMWVLISNTIVFFLIVFGKFNLFTFSVLHKGYMKMDKQKV